MHFEILSQNILSFSQGLQPNLFFAFQDFEFLTLSLHFKFRIINFYVNHILSQIDQESLVPAFILNFGIIEISWLKALNAEKGSVSKAWCVASGSEIADPFSF